MSDMAPIERILNEIKTAVEEKLYYSAIAVALSLPEICSRLEQQTPESNRSEELYNNFFNRYIKKKYPKLKGGDLYYIRCGIAHTSTLSHRKAGFSRIIFTLPDGRGNIFHNNIINDAINIDLTIFCADIIAAVEAWFHENKENDTVLKNLKNAALYRENGIPPYITGIPVIS
ncbi:hypothetical protein [Oceanibaculum sp.]|uniref:hypothetical protein n=1 Tax=Oceanibaculum sp. TaxID=1903597 RepID=UPI002585AAD6|nr:hypothetical protein [Oceanibaculum sp.]MCH2394331.1 hypothetical protein [Oceanibaculum sp.]